MRAPFSWRYMLACSAASRLTTFCLPLPSWLSSSSSSSCGELLGLPSNASAKGPDSKEDAGTAPPRTTASRASSDSRPSVRNPLRDARQVCSPCPSVCPPPPPHPRCLLPALPPAPPNQRNCPSGTHVGMPLSQKAGTKKWQGLHSQAGIVHLRSAQGLSGRSSAFWRQSSAQPKGGKALIYQCEPELFAMALSLLLKAMAVGQRRCSANQLQHNDDIGGACSVVPECISNKIGKDLDIPM